MGSKSRGTIYGASIRAAAERGSGSPPIREKLTATECKRSADLCARLASEAADKFERSILERMADQWRRLANYKQKKSLKKSAISDDKPAK